MTEYVYISGKTKWFRHERAEVPPNSTDQTPQWSHVIYPNTESLEKIRVLQAEGLKNVLHHDDDGFNIRFSRKVQIRVKGQYMPLSAPLVVLADGVTPLQGLVGNGSDVTTKLEVYKHRVPGPVVRHAKAARWLSSRIDSLIPYEAPRDFTATDTKAAEGLKDQLPQTNMF